jgi:hypothetical protein
MTPPPHEGGGLTAPGHYPEYGVWRRVGVGPAGPLAEVGVDGLQGPIDRVLQLV